MHTPNNVNRKSPSPLERLRGSVVQTGDLLTPIDVPWNAQIDDGMPARSKDQATCSRSNNARPLGRTTWLLIALAGALAAVIFAMG